MSKRLVPGMNLLGSALTSIKPRKDDTLIDRLNYYYSSMIIIGLSITLTVLNSSS
jgi:hypothetical protein